MEAITPALLDQLPLAEIERVTFFKRDELTSDLICCNVQAAGRGWLFHEEMTGWELCSTA
jgi:aminoglycoside phosphotransferase